MKIFLIGMPGSGKSTMGKLLAQRLTLPFVDLDAEIEDNAGKPVKEIFSTSGEDYFRKLESDSLKNWALSDKNFVMATGGGAPCFHNGINIINAAGLSIFLDTPLEEIIVRIEKDTTRPLLRSADGDELKSKLENIRTARLPCYKRAHIVVSDSNLDTVLREMKLRT